MPEDAIVQTNAVASETGSKAARIDDWKRLLAEGNHRLKHDLARDLAGDLEQRLAEHIGA